MKNPSWLTGIARQGNAKHPSLFQGLEFAISPELGNTGETLRDLSGHGAHLPLWSSPSWVAGPHGPMLDCSSNYAEVVSGVADYLGFERTMVAWGELDTSGFRHIFNWASSASANYSMLQTNTSGHVRWRAFGSGGTVSIVNSDINYAGTGLHCFVGVTRASNEHELWVDGELVNTGTTNILAYTGSSTFTIGDLYGGSGDWDGRIGTCAAYRRALTAQEIALWSSRPTAWLKTATRTSVFVPSAAPVSLPPVVADPSPCERPSYSGNPDISVASVTPKITIERTTGPHGEVCMVSADQSTYAPEGGGGEVRAWNDCEFKWDFGDPGRYAFRSPWKGPGVTEDMSTEQYGPVASFRYMTAGEKTISLRMRGRDSAGNIIEASTSQVLRLCQYYLFTANATGGTYTLTYGGQTTNPIAYDAHSDDVVAALIADTALTAETVRTTASLIDFTGSLAGTDVTLTLNGAGLTGTTNTPEAIKRFTGETVTGYTVTDYTGWEQRYLDANATGANDGTSEADAWTDYTSAQAWMDCISIAKDKQVLWVARGTTYPVATRMRFHRGREMHIRAYGTGAKPTFTGGQSIGGTMVDVENEFFDIDWTGNILLEGLRYEAAQNYPLSISPSTSGDATLPRRQFRGWTFADLEVVRTAGSEALMRARGVLDIHNSDIQGIHVWNSSFDMGQHDGLANINTTMGEWCSVVNTDHAGIEAASDIFDHFMYLNCNRSLLLSRHDAPDVEPWRWMNFTLNGNASGDYPSYDWLVTDSWIRNTQNGLDFSNTGNTVNTPDQFINPKVQFCKFDPGPVSTQRTGILTYASQNLDVSWCDFTGSTRDLAIGCAVVAAAPYDHVTRVWNCNFYNTVAAYNLRHPEGQLTSNKVYATGPANNAAFQWRGNDQADLSAWNIRGNTLYVPNNSGVILRDTDNATDYNYAWWQSQGFDVDAAAGYEDPEFHDPANDLLRIPCSGLQPDNSHNVDALDLDLFQMGLMARNNPAPAPSFCQPSTRPDTLSVNCDAVARAPSGGSSYSLADWEKVADVIARRHNLVRVSHDTYERNYVVTGLTSSDINVRIFVVFDSNGPHLQYTATPQTPADADASWTDYESVAATPYNCSANYTTFANVVANTTWDGTEGGVVEPGVVSQLGSNEMAIYAGEAPAESGDPLFLFEAGDINKAFWDAALSLLPQNAYSRGEGDNSYFDLPTNGWQIRHQDGFEQPTIDADTGELVCRTFTPASDEHTQFTVTGTKEAWDGQYILETPHRYRFHIDLDVRGDASDWSGNVWTIVAQFVPSGNPAGWLGSSEPPIAVYLRPGDDVFRLIVRGAAQGSTDWDHETVVGNSLTSDMLYGPHQLVIEVESDPSGANSYTGVWLNGKLLGSTTLANAKWDDAGKGGQLVPLWGTYTFDPQNTDVAIKRLSCRKL